MNDDAIKRRLESFESAHKAAGDVEQNKVSFYTAGSQKKSKREREKEAAEAKRVQEEEDAAKAYRDFVASFEGPEDDARSSSSASRSAPTRDGRASSGSGFKTFLRAGEASASPPVGARGTSSASASTALRGAPSFNALASTSHDSAPISNAAPKGPRGRPITSGQSSYPPSGASGRGGQNASASGSASASVFDNDEPVSSQVSGPRKNRAMDSFLEQLKRDQAERESRLQSRVQQGVATSVSAAAAEDLGGRGGDRNAGSYDTGDGTTTNLHVGNLPANVTAATIGMHFAQFGPVGSVKIMWPRDDMGQSMGMVAAAPTFLPGGAGLGIPGQAVPMTKKAGLNGFIAFMKRKDAEKALRACDGVEWNGAVLRLGWGKGMPIPPRPAYVAATPFGRSGRSRSRSRSPDHKRSRRRSRSISRDRMPDDNQRSSRKRGRRSDSYDSRSRSRSRSGSRDGRSSRRRRRSDSYNDRRSRSRSRSRSRERGRDRDGVRRRSRSRSRSRSFTPSSERRWPKLASEDQRRLLEDISVKVRQYGKRFEDTLRDKERNNPKFDFLRDDNLPEYHYFKMLLDRRYRAPSPPPPAFLDDGDLDVITSDDSEYEDEMYAGRRGVLGRLPRSRLEGMLRTLSNTRDKIARVMSFALNRPDAADEVVDVLVQSLVILSTPVPRKVARLNVVSDILHNCAGTPTNAWKYRSLFEARLPDVFSHLGDVHKSFPGRMKAEIFRKQIMTIVNVWENWLVFTPTVLQDLQARLEAGNEDSDIGRASREASDMEPLEKPRDSPATGPASGLGRPGFAKAGFSAVQTGEAEIEVVPEDEEDLDGEVIMPAKDVDGDPIDGEDIDGAPM